ncbi:MULTISPECIES: helix-turn-helix domain-containing protein [Paenibacillus]|uniref:Transcriptional regulator with XRE-family HTH domain n=2 Tax=Paenibacillus TaxID=44249 RepID=A0AAP5HAX6_PAEAM|nr:MULTISPECIES: helix-turn-helix transcriptional regulator [Paenibacillus]KQY86396.1 transcriptional regulator [Paenibacillus sp. Root52]MCG7380685.1 helix-turn-helix transcriptional regulator [Paenibacillus sp. ACRSA]MCM3175954.1 helix-turn-helix transcriptional regulator [Paenibacillus sp. MER 99-2]MDQ0173672.1 transcriptional regulator with XRE-family HTH domain [Paenibacillus tundrae]MDR6727171.1 transcriptional regulator with XRE-family HTH domain [Paenibacillus amylolyticus]
MENVQLANRIRAFRKLKGLTQQELASKTRISLATLGTIERGNRKVSEQELNRIAEMLGISVSEIRGE